MISKKQYLKALNTVKEYHKQTGAVNISPRSFYVVTPSDLDNLTALSIELDNYERAKEHRDRARKNKRKTYPNAFIVSTLNEV